MLGNLPFQHGRRACGFTLVELMVVVVILAVLMGLGLPTFTQMLRNYQIRNAATAVVNGIQRARAEGITRNSNVRFCMGDVARSTWDVDFQTVACSTTISTAALDSRLHADGSANVTLVVRIGGSTGTQVSTGAVGITFNNLGQMITNSGGLAAFDTIEFDATSTSGISQKREVRIGAGGNARSCDPAISFATNARGC